MINEQILTSIFSLEDIAAYLHVHPSTIYRLIKSKKIPHFRVGREYRFREREIDAWIASMEHQNAN